MDWSKIKVVELASVLAGPAVGTFFAELGAQVIKVENGKTGGDVTRGWKLSTEDKANKTSAYFASVNHSKEYLFLNLSDPNDLALVQDHIRSADIVVSNFKASSAVKLGMDFSSLQALNPNIILGEITGYPTGNRPAFDVVLQAETGFLAMSGTDSNHLAKMPVALIDVLAAHQLKEGILVAMLEQQYDGKAKHVQVSLYEAALASLANQASNFLMAGHIPKPIGTQHPNIAPYGDLIQSSDGGKIVLAVGTENHFEQLCSALELDELKFDNRFMSNTLRVANRETLMYTIQSASEVLAMDELCQKLSESKVPFGVVKTMDEVFKDEEAKNLVLKSKEQDESTERVRHNVFRIA